MCRTEASPGRLYKNKDDEISAEECLILSFRHTHVLCKTFCLAGLLSCSFLRSGIWRSFTCAGWLTGMKSRSQRSGPGCRLQAMKQVMPERIDGTVGGARSE